MLEFWGPDYKVEFSFSVMNIPNGDKEYNILHITDEKNQYQNLLVSVKNGTLHINSTDENFLFGYIYESGYDYNIVIQQTGKSKVNSYYFLTYGYLSIFSMKKYVPFFMVMKNTMVGISKFLKPIVLCLFIFQNLQ